MAFILLFSHLIVTLAIAEDTCALDARILIER
jgi:hypothetical protein